MPGRKAMPYPTPASDKAGRANKANSGAGGPGDCGMRPWIGVQDDMISDCELNSTGEVAPNKAKPGKNRVPGGKAMACPRPIAGSTGSARMILTALSTGRDTSIILLLRRVCIQPTGTAYPDDSADPSLTPLLSRDLRDPRICLFCEKFGRSGNLGDLAGPRKRQFRVLLFHETTLVVEAWPPPENFRALFALTPIISSLTGQIADTKVIPEGPSYGRVFPGA
jgi:hypothetical protein